MYIEGASVDDAGHVGVVAATDDAVIAQPLAAVHHGRVERLRWYILDLLGRVEVPDLKHTHTHTHA